MVLCNNLAFDDAALAMVKQYEVLYVIKKHIRLA
jgi:hypothetical protein